MLHPITGLVLKIFGKGPREVGDVVVEEFLKFDSSSKSFKTLTAVRSFSSAVDGFVLRVKK